MIQKTLVLLSAALLAFIGESEAKRSWGGCPKPTLQSNFDVTQYVGTWYEIARDKSLPFEYGDCVQARYGLQPDGILTVQNSQVNPNTGSIDQANAKAKCDGPHCHVKFFLTYSGDYRVLSTDYTNYAIVYSCTSYVFFKDEYVWILARTETLPAVDLSSYESLISANTDYSLSNLYFTVQGGSCIYLP